MSSGKLRQSPGSPVSTDILRVEGLSVRYHTPGGAVRAADGITFRLGPGERLGIVDLPDPDSPAMPRRSPGRRRNVMPSAARMAPPGV